MNYITGIDNTPYYHWQTELLIESFRMQNMEDKLWIGINNPQLPAIEKFTKNLKSHKNKFFFENKLNSDTNRIYAILLAIRNKVIEPPFTLIDSDMVLMKPIDPISEFIADISFHTRESDEILKKHLSPEVEKILNSYQIKKENVQWMPLGKTLVFNSADEKLLLKALWWAENLFEKFKDTGLDLERAAWTMAFHEYLFKYKFKNEFYEVTLFHNDVEAPFLHYNQGLPPDFVKRNFTYEKASYGFLSPDGTPYAAILKNNPTTTTNHLQKVVKSYLA